MLAGSCVHARTSANDGRRTQEVSPKDAAGSPQQMELHGPGRVVLRTSIAIVVLGGVITWRPYGRCGEPSLFRTTPEGSTGLRTVRLHLRMHGGFLFGFVYGVV